jgi:hypothetical protein
MNRSKMIYFIMVYIVFWYGGSLLGIKYFGLDAVTALGVGTVGGVFVASFKDAWQFFWRRASPEESAKAKIIENPPCDPKKGGEV